MSKRIFPKLKTEQVRAALRLAYTQPEWALFFEVADGTGAAQRRWADAMAMNMYPSRGLSVHGFEIKVSRSDLKRELSNPEKAESVAQYCDYWYIVAPKGMIDADELPDTWGLMEVDESGRITTKVKAERTDSVCMGRPMIASMLRSAAKLDEGVVSSLVQKARLDEREKVEDMVLQRTKDIRSDGATLIKMAEEVKEKTGVDLLSYKWDSDKLSRVIKLAEAGALDSWRGVDSLAKDLSSALDLVKKMQEVINT